MSETAHLKRSLKLWHLILYGIVIIQPTAPMGIYGVVSNIAHGHVVTTILLAMVAMLFTAFSYGRMARVYPQAGSAFTYVSQEFHPRAGYIVGWAMLMDYLLNPIICIIWCSQAARNILPDVPYVFWVIAFTLLSTLLNSRGVQTSSRVNAILTAAMSVVVVLFLGEAVHYVLSTVHPSPADLIRPVYDRSTFSASSVLHGTSVAVLTYIGFDGISTLAEEVENPRRNILLATVITCFSIGLLSTVEVYAAQLAWPSREPFPSAIVDTAFVHVAARVGGRFLFQLLNATLLIANLGSGIAAQFGASRLLYSMGRAQSLPQNFFGRINERTRVPQNNVIAVGALALAGAFLLTYESGAELLNFGAFIAFIGVNAAALVHYGFRSREKVLLPIAIPAAGITICIFIWLHLGAKAQIFGFSWLAVGGLVALLQRRKPAQPATAD